MTTKNQFMKIVVLSGV